jgi:hypothetical protein
MHRLRSCLALLGLLVLVGLARAEDTLEIIPLQNRTPEEMIPRLQPFLEPGGALTGMQGNLILRASPANRAQIKQALAALDVAPRQLLITVRQSLDRTHAQQSFVLHGRIDTDSVDIDVPPGGRGGTQVEIGDGHLHIGARLDDRSLNQTSQVSQQVRVADGGRAMIQTGVELPLTLRETVNDRYGQSVRESVVFYRAGSGFHVAPQLIGDRVTLEIHPVQQTLDAAAPRSVVGQQLHTTISGRLGEWIALGGGDTQDQQERRRLLGTSQGNARETGQVWLKVDVAE